MHISLLASRNRILAAILAVWCAQTAVAADDVVLTLSDGRQIVADAVGPETDDRHIAVRIERERMVLTRLVAWSEVAAVRIGGRGYWRDVQQDVPADLRQVAVGASVDGSGSGTKRGRLPYDEGFLQEVVSPCEAPVVPLCSFRCDIVCGLPMEATIIGVRDDPLSAYPELTAEYYPEGVPVSEIPFALELLREKKIQQVLFSDRPPAGREVPPEFVPPAPPAALMRPAVQSLVADAYPIGAHGKVDWDSLAVELDALDAFGRPTSFDGTLRLTLWGQEQTLVRARGEEFFAKPGRVVQIATWTRPVRSGGFQPARVIGGREGEVVSAVGTVRLILPLPRPLPDHDLSRAAFGELHVQLLAPGQGVFETTQRDILLRHRGQLRDQNLVETGSRFFAEEATYDNPRRGGLRFRNYFSSRPEGRILTVQP